MTYQDDFTLSKPFLDIVIENAYQIVCISTRAVGRQSIQAVEKVDLKY